MYLLRLGPRFSVRCPYYRGVFLRKTCENFVGTYETVRNREVFVLERCP